MAVRLGDDAELSRGCWWLGLGGVMDVPADQSARVVQRIPPGTVRRARRRRPTGEPPPLPHHLQTSGVGWLIAAVVLVALTVAVFARGLRGLAVDVTVADDAVASWLTGLHAPGLVGLWRALAVLSSWWVLNGLLAGLLVALLVLRRFRHLIVVVILAQLLSLIVEAWVGPLAQRPRPFGVVIRAGWGGWALPSVQVTFLAAGLVMSLYTLVPEGRWRNNGKWVATGWVALAALGRIALGAEAPTDVLVSAAIGVTLPLVAFRLFAPSEVFPITYRRGRSAHLDVTGPRGVAIRRGLEDQLGLVVEELKPFGLAGSAGSTPLRITLKGDPPTQLFAKLYARSHLRADRWYKLGRELLYGRLEDEKPFNTVRRLVQQEDYALSLMQRAGLPSPTPHGFVELTPEREYLLVTEFFAGAVELGEAEVDEQVINDGLSIIRKLWDAGLAHRDIKPANLLVRHGRMQLIDVAFVQARPSPWRQAVDLANMMLCLALRSSPELVYRRALQYFTVEEISEGFAAAHGLAIPSQLRHMLRAQGRDLHGEFVRLLPTPPQPIRIQRWSARRIALLALVVVLLVLLLQNIVGGITSSEAAKTPLYIDNLSCTDLEPLWLQAQAVPSASLVPCVRFLPVGWSVAQVTVNDGRSVITLDHDRAGAAALVVRLTAVCTPSGAVEGPSAMAGVRHYQGIESTTGEFTATWYDQFPGGCVTSRLHLTTDPNGEFAAQAPQVLGFTSRQALQEALSQRSAGRLQLDPGNAR
jgi:tRNA A-37 threonylcarbamoyl transferase component Bud32/membrane-associated phospholipid phosphatase